MLTEIIDCYLRVFKNYGGRLQIANSSGGE